MKTRVIQDEPEEPTAQQDPATPAEPERPTHRAGRTPATASRTATGRWSARRWKLAVWATITALVLGAAYWASRPGSDAPAANGAGIAEPQFAAIESFVEEEMAAQRIPGLAMGIVEGDRIVYVRGFGKADDTGRAVTPQTPFIIGSVAKSITAMAIMQLVEAGKVELDAPVQQYLPWFRVADEEASAEITVRHLLNQTSGLSQRTGRSLEANGDTSDGALENAVRELRSTELTAPVGETFQYSGTNYSILGLIAQTVAGRSFESYVQTQIFDPLQMRNSYTSEGTAQQQGLTTGYHYWFGRPRAADLPYNRVLVPAGYLISSAEDMTHYLIAQLNDGVYQTTSVLSPAGVRELHRPGVPPQRGTSYAMGWYVGPVNGIPAIWHQGEVYNYHANVVLVPESRRGVVVLMNAQNSLDLLIGGNTASGDRMKTIAEGVMSLLEAREPSPPPSNIGFFLVYAFVFAVIVLQVRGMIRSVDALRKGRVPRGRIGPRWRIGMSLALSVAWALLILVLVPRQLGPPLLVIARPLPDLTYILLVSAIVALGWGIVRAIWAYSVLRKAESSEMATHVPTT